MTALVPAEFYHNMQEWWDFHIGSKDMFVGAFYALSSLTDEIVADTTELLREQNRQMCLDGDRLPLDPKVYVNRPATDGTGNPLYLFSTVGMKVNARKSFRPSGPSDQ